MLKWLRSLKPIMIENSKVPVILSYVAPIEIWAIAFGPFVWCRGVMSDVVKRHERIHFAQQIECLFVFQWLLYHAFYLKGLVLGKKGADAYRSNAFEVEAYTHELDENYLENRPFYNWVNYL